MTVQHEEFMELVEQITKLANIVAQQGQINEGHLKLIDQQKGRILALEEDLEEVKGWFHDARK